MLPEFSQLNCAEKRAKLAFVLQNRANIPLHLIKSLMFVAPKTNNATEKILNTHQDSSSLECSSVPHDLCSVELSDGLNVVENSNMNNGEKPLTAPTGHYKPESEGSSCFKSIHVPKIAIFGDSHAKQCVSTIQSIFTKKEANVTGNVYPGAPMSYICDNIEEAVCNYTKNDAVVLIGGTNSLHYERECGNIQSLIQDLILKLQHTNIILTSIPYRYDQPEWNKTILNINKQIYDIVLENRDVSFIPINNLLTCSNFTHHGLHMNKIGKDILCTAVALHVTFKVNMESTIRSAHEFTPVKINSSGRSATMNGECVETLLSNTTAFYGWATPQLEEQARGPLSYTVPSSTPGQEKNQEFVDSSPTT
ncbi:hypothetical protein J6590_088259 [Homalodisca vitripennis]|nr:hypothetical protein J6590_088259 [Homalodisca vitripennis]